MKLRMVFLVQVYAGLARDRAQRAARDLLSRARHGHEAGFRGMLELFVRPTLANLEPSVGFDLRDDVAAVHVCVCTHPAGPRSRRSVHKCAPRERACAAYGTLARAEGLTVEQTPALLKVTRCGVRSLTL